MPRPRKTPRHFEISRDPPSYDHLRTAPLSDKDRYEFGVSDTRELVGLLNALWRDEDRPPLPQGSFPKNANLLKFVIKETRLAMERMKRSKLHGP